MVCGCGGGRYDICEACIIYCNGHDLVICRLCMLKRVESREEKCICNDCSSFVAPHSAQR